MPTQTDRRSAFRTAIASFIQDNKPGSDYEEWLANKVDDAKQVQVATHPLRATFPKAHVNEASSPFVQWDELTLHQEIGSHDIKHAIWDIPGNSASSLPLGKFLLGVIVDGQPLIHWLLNNDADFIAALSNDNEAAVNLATGLRQIDRTSQPPASHVMAKQVYWLVGNEPAEDSQYHQLQPCFSIGMCLFLFSEINAIYGRNEAENHKQARTAYFKYEASAGTYHQYRNLAFLKIGGSHPKNISYQFQQMGGKNYLLASLPPQWKEQPARLKHLKSLFGGSHELRKAMKPAFKALVELLKPDPAPNMKTRISRKDIEQEIVAQLVIFAETIHQRFPAGWTQGAELDRSEQLWLDPQRSESDEAFMAEYEAADWQHEVAERFANWLNAELRKAGGPLVAMGLPEARHWAKQAIEAVKETTA